MREGDAIRQIEPTITRRPVGGYLAASVPGSPLSIGVIGTTEEEARTLFYDEREAWATLRERDDER